MTYKLCGDSSNRKIKLSKKKSRYELTEYQRPCGVVWKIKIRRGNTELKEEKSERRKGRKTD